MKIILLLLAASIYPALVQAEVDGSMDLKTQAQACAGIAKPDARLACYDKAFPPSETAKTTDEVKPEAQFGLSQHQLRERNPESSATTEIEAKITAVRIDGRGKRVVTLDNGHVWAILESNSKGFLKAGDQTSVRKASLGTFMLLSPAGVALRARRID